MSTQAEDRRLVERMTSWATTEDEGRDSVRPAAEVAHMLPELLGLADAIPSEPAGELLFPPIAGGPTRRR